MTTEEESRPRLVATEGGAAQTNFSADNILSHSDEVMANYRHLCQTAQQHIATPSRFTCKVADRGHPQLLLQPANIETIMLGDDVNITVFRDFLLDSEREHLIATARGQLERSVASVGTEYMPVDFRVSSVAWLKPNHTTVIEQIHRRINAATGLDLYSAEELQVSNYGIVGLAALNCWDRYPPRVPPSPIFPSPGWIAAVFPVSRSLVLSLSLSF